MAAATSRFAAEATAERHSSHVLPLCAEALRAVAIAPSALAAHRVRRRAGELHRPARRPGGRQGPGARDRAFRSTWCRRWRRWLSTSCASRRAAPRGVTAVPCLDAGKGEVYVGGYRRRSTRRWCARRPGAAAFPRPHRRVAGRGAQRPRRGQWCGAACRPGKARCRRAQRRRPSAAWPCCRSARRGRRPGARAVPLYGRPPDITVKRKGP